MKNLSLVINVVLLILVGYLFFQAQSNKKAIQQFKAEVRTDSTGDSNKHFPIAYINMDSIQANYSYFQKLKSDFETKQKSASNELTAMQKRFQSRTKQLQDKAATMTMDEQEKAMAEINKMQQDFQNKQQSVDQELYDHNNKLQQEILDKIETYLKDYNKDGKYAYIFSYEPGLMYYKDSVLDITNDVLIGLNKSDDTSKKDKK